MSNRLILPLVLLASALGIYLLVKPAATPPPYPEPSVERGGVGEGEAAMRTEPPSLTGSPRGAPAPPQPEAPTPVVRADQLPRGVLTVLPRGVDGKPLSPREIRVRVERTKGGDFWAQPEGIPDYDSGVWTFPDILAGSVRVTVHGDLVADSSQEVTIPARGQADVVVDVKPAGSITYRVVLYSGELPLEATLTLLDAKRRRPVPARWQVRKPDLLTAERRGPAVTQGPEGIVYGIPPGRYVLKVESMEGEFEEAEVEVKPGASEHVEIRVRK